jgi:hypothetical protein
MICPGREVVGFLSNREAAGTHGVVFTVMSLWRQTVGVPEINNCGLFLIKSQLSRIQIVINSAWGHPEHVRMRKHAERWFENRFSFSWFVNSGDDIFIIKLKKKHY